MGHPGRLDRSSGSTPESVTPRLDLAGAERLAESLYDLGGEISELPSYADCNFRLRVRYGSQYVLKIANSGQRVSHLVSQHRTMDYLARHCDAVTVPRIRPTTAGDEVTSVRLDGHAHLVRLVTYVEGIPLAVANDPSPAMMSRVGEMLGRVDAVLRTYPGPVADRYLRWDLERAADLAPCTKVIEPSTRRRHVQEWLDHFAAHVLPALRQLPRQIIHNDANDQNILVPPDPAPCPLGLIDFGDMVLSRRVCEPAVALTYLMLGKENDPLAAAVPALEAYHRVNPLTRGEIELLPALIQTRLVMSVTISCFESARTPGNAYLTVDQDRAWRLLDRFRERGHEWCAAAVGAACRIP